MEWIKGQARPVALSLSTAALLVACGGGGGSAGDEGRMGALRVAMTDAPACGYDQVNVTVEKLRVHASDAAGDNDAGWSEIAVSPAKRVNLLDLQNGVLEELGVASLPEGRYRQLRVVLAANSGTNPPANSVVPSGGSEVALTTPSAAQSGLKLNANIEVRANETADVVLDFDACKSVVRAGASNRYLLKPVISILPRVTAAQAVEGYVATTLAAGTTTVTLQQNGVVARSTVPGSNGKFVLSMVPAGTYDLVVSAQGRVTAVMTGVPVSTSGFTTVNPATAPIDPPTTTLRTASGKVTTTGSSTIPDAGVHAMQTLGSTTVEVASVRVDADSGAYSLALPTGAPVRTAYAANATTVTFTTEPTAAGKYSLEARVSGKPTQTSAIDLTNADASASFAFAP